MSFTFRFQINFNFVLHEQKNLSLPLKKQVSGSLECVALNLSNLHNIARVCMMFWMVDKNDLQKKKTMNGRKCRTERIHTHGSNWPCVNFFSVIPLKFLSKR